MERHPREMTKVAEGKTKVIWGVPGEDWVVLEAKPDITAGDGKKHDTMAGKEEWATTTTCNVFELLRIAGIPVAYRRKVNATSFEALRCNMIPLEVVVRREAHGSCLERYPQFKKGDRFERLMVEWFLKTKNKQWEGLVLPADDPYMMTDGYIMNLCHPHQPLGDPFTGELNIPGSITPSRLHQMAFWARLGFLILEDAWNSWGYRLVDYKIELGIGPKGELLVADVIDNDSWRLVNRRGDYEDKQWYRDGGSLDEVAARYARVAERSADLLCTATHRHRDKAFERMMREMSLPNTVKSIW